MSTRTVVTKQFNKAASRPVVTSIATALFVRFSLLVYLSITGKLSTLGDQVDFLRVVVARMETPVSEWDGRIHQLWSSSKSYLIPIKFLFTIFGVHPFLPKVLTVICGALVAGIVTFLVLKLTSNRRIALCAGLLIAFDPSAILWSTLIMRDAFIWIALASVALILNHAHSRDDSSKFSLSPFLLILVIIFLRYLRIHTTAVVCIAILLAEICAIKKINVKSTLIIAIAIFTPWFLNLGFLGSSVTTMDMKTVEIFRSSHSAGSTGFGTANTNPTNPTNPTNTDTPTTDETIGLASWRYLPRGLSAMWLEPLPHQLNGNKKMLAAFVEQLFWLPIFFFALIGFFRLRKREAPYLYVFFLFGGTTVVWAMTDGNYLSAHRHRGEFMWAAVIMAAVGLQTVMKQIKKRQIKPEESKIIHS